jgi:DNA-binding NtrC family response regulator
MTPNANTKYVLVIDRQDYWRELSAQTLTSAGYLVRAVATYDYPPSSDDQPERVPDLVILGCASIGVDEQQLIARVLEYKHHLVVFCVSLPMPLMRLLFLKGADDVGDKPYDPDQLVNSVEQALDAISSRSDYLSKE